MNKTMIILALVPLFVTGSFFAHWITLLKIQTAAERLPYCRGAYLAFSFQLVLYSWIGFQVTGVSGPAAYLVPLGMTFSFAGDVFNLQFDAIARRIKEPVFGGIISFALAQFFYIGAILSLIEPGLLISDGYLLPVLAALIIVPAVLFRLRVYNPSRPPEIMRGALIYGFILGGMSALAISAALAAGGVWYFVAAGAFFFLLSDAVMGETTIYGRHPVFEYQVPWVTYLAAQGLIIYGTLLLAGGAR